MARCRLDGQASGFESAYELADVLSHSSKPAADACLAIASIHEVGLLPDRSAHSCFASSSIRSRRV